MKKTTNMGDFPLRSGVKLLDATKEQIEAEAEFYEQQIVRNLFDAAADYVRLFDAHTKQHGRPLMNDMGGAMFEHSLEILKYGRTWFDEYRMPRDVARIFRVWGEGVGFSKEVLDEQTAA
jgi:hypothetical protein